MAKPSKDRRAVLEELRKEQARAEKKRTSLVIVGAVVVALVIVGLAAYPLIKQDRRNNEDVAALGVPASQAGCTDPVATKAEGSADHRQVGTELDYDQSPPAAGPHYPTWAPRERKFYSPQDRPEIGYLVHNLEHGYNILWYDETIAEDEDQLSTVKAIASKFEGEGYENKFIAAPWTSEDGEPFPDGAHVALTHWSMGGRNGIPEGQHGVTQYCDAPSGEAVTSFVEDWPYTDSPEPGAA